MRSKRGPDLRARCLHVPWHMHATRGDGGGGAKSAADGEPDHHTPTYAVSTTALARVASTITANTSHCPNAEELCVCVCAGLVSEH